MKKHLRIVSLILVSLIAGAIPAVSQIENAKVTGGDLRGVVADGISSFKGIPFAEPPVGDLRWKAPQPLKPWSGNRPADTFARACMQLPPNLPEGVNLDLRLILSEDCLYLNVWTGAKSKSEKRPVMVWIHGGGFSGGMTGTPIYDGANLARKGVVLVSIAYRLGPFGFLAHPELSRESGHGSGNYGLLDMVAALKWVQNNIAQFGGDSSRVTIFGQSAGALAINMLAASPVAKGLYQRAISESGGGSFAPARIGNEFGEGVLTLQLAESIGEQYLKSAGAANIKEARALSAEQILKNFNLRTEQILKNLGTIGPVTAAFMPVADNHVLPLDEYLAYQAGQFNDTPILAGWNSAELGSQKISPDAFEKQVRSEYGEAADAILSAYPHATEAEVSQSSEYLMRDSVMAWHTCTWARLQSQKGRNKAYIYYFDHRIPGMPNGAPHGFEIPYVFGNLDTARNLLPMDFQPEDPAMSDLMISYWINFAATGDPNGSGLPSWPAFTEKKENVMFFGKTSGSAGPLPNIEKLKAVDVYYRWRRKQAESSDSSPKN